MIQTIVITGARAPAALHLARLFHHDGYRVVLADTLAHPVARGTRSHAAYERLPPPRQHIEPYAKVWRELLSRHDPALVIPVCEEVFYLAALRDIFGIPIPLFAPPLDLLAHIHDKAAFAAMARGFGADPPQTQLLRDRDDVARAAPFSHDLVFKPVWSRFGSRVLIRPAQHHLRGLTPTAADPWIAQTYMPGDEICAHAAATRGQISAFQAYRPLYRAGPGASVAFEPVAAPDIERFVQAFVADVAWTGHIAFDFKRDAKGLPRVLECNPRPTSGVHFFQASNGLPRAILEGAQAVATERRAMTLPLAMAVYGFMDAWRQGGIVSWARRFTRMGDIAAWRGDGHLAGAQLLALAEIAWLALRRGQGLREASTQDIEWNGEPFKAP